MKITAYTLKHHGKTALALVEYVDAGGTLTVETAREIILKNEPSIGPQGTAGFWSKGEDGTGLVYRLEPGPVKPTDAAGLTERCLVTAEAFKEAQVKADPDRQLWTALAEHLEGVAQLIRTRFAA